MPEPPPLNRDQVAAELKRLRLATGLSTHKAAERAGMSQSQVVRFEAGRHVPDTRRMTDLLDAYEPTQDERGALLRSAREQQGGKQKQVVMHKGATTAQRRIDQAERAATRIVTFSPLLVPGLLQAPKYMRAVGATQLSGNALESWVEARQERQAKLRAPGDTTIKLYTTAGALTWGLGGAEVMLEQIERLVDATRADTYRFGIVPAGAETDQFALHALDLKETPTGRLIDFGTHSGVVTVTDPAHQVEALEVLREVERLAVTGAAARAELEQAARLYR